MRALLVVTLVTAAALAVPALALTVSSAPNREAVSQLKQERGPIGGGDLRDSLAGGGRPLAGAGYSDGPGYGSTVTYGFGSVTTTVRTERQDFRTRVFAPPEFGPSPSTSTSIVPSELVKPRR